MRLVAQPKFPLPFGYQRKHASFQRLRDVEYGNNGLFIAPDIAAVPEQTRRGYFLIATCNPFSNQRKISRRHAHKEPGTIDRTRHHGPGAQYFHLRSGPGLQINSGRQFAKQLSGCCGPIIHLYQDIRLIDGLRDDCICRTQCRHNKCNACDQKPVIEQEQDVFEYIDRFIFIVFGRQLLNSLIHHLFH